MFVRLKRSGKYEYLQIVENKREGKKTRQRVLASLGRLDQLQSKDGIEVLLQSLSRFSTQIELCQAQAQGDLEALGAWSLGPTLAFGRLWARLGLDKILKKSLAKRSFEFEVEKAIFLTVLHRLFESGSDRQAMHWKRGLHLPGAENIKLHHFYRAMRFLGESKDKIEEELFFNNRNLFTELSLVFLDTTSLYFEGQGGESLGQYGYSKDRRADRRQVIVGALLTQEGRPISCDISPGNNSDVKALLPTVDKTRERFDLQKVCWVADRGMWSQEVINGLEERGMDYILGARLRKAREIKEKVLSAKGDFQKVEENLYIKEVIIEDRRYIVCHNPQEAEKDKQAREDILKSLEEKLRREPKSLVGNSGYRRFLKIKGEAVFLDLEKVAKEEVYDGKFVLRTNTTLPKEEVAIQYKRLWLVESFFRLAKDLLQTRPVYHKCDDTIKGHIFCSFLALLLRHELISSLEKKKLKLEWSDIIRDLEALEEVEVKHNNQHYLLRLPLQGVCGKVLQAIGVAVPPPVKELKNVVPRLFS